MMRARRRSDPIRSLDSIDRGETVVVECILFDAVRDLCRDVGLHLGERVRCRDVSGARMLLETARGHLVTFERQWARFIQVAPSASLRMEGVSACA